MKEKIGYPRVLIISHNVLSESSNMGKTLKSFFQEWPKDALAQLYFRAEVPEIDICSTYYRITDLDILKAIYSRHIPGNILTNKLLLQYNRTDENLARRENNLYEYGKKRRPYMYIIRNSIWNMKKWDNDQLDEWIKEFKPELVFFASGDYTFSYKIAVSISKKYNIPLIIGVYDDYYIDINFGISPFYYINKFNYRGIFRKSSRQCKKLIYVCDSMKNDYSYILGNKGITLMTPATVSYSPIKNKEGSIKISYIGNLGLNRWESLVEIGRILLELNKNQDMYLDVYSIETRPEILRHMVLENGIRFNGKIDGEEVKKVMCDSDILVHVESRNKTTKKRVKYSISTKIADSLAIGRPILAYGPEGIASIDYLLENQAACVVTREERLKEKIIELIENNDLRAEYAKKGLELAKKRHDKCKNRRILKEVIEAAIKEGGSENESFTN